MTLLKAVRITLVGGDVTKWIVNRLSLTLDGEKARREGLVAPGVVMTSYNRAVYIDVEEDVHGFRVEQEDPMPYLGEDGYVEFAVLRGAIESAGTNHAIIETALRRLNGVTGGLVDGATKISVELERESVEFT